MLLKEETYLYGAPWCALPVGEIRIVRCVFFLLVTENCSSTEQHVLRKKDSVVTL